MIGRSCLGEQLLGQEQPPGLCKLDRRDAEFLPDRAAELAAAKAQLTGQFFQASFVVQGASLDPRRGQASRSPDGIDGCMARRQLGPAPQAGPEPRPLR